MNRTRTRTGTWWNAAMGRLAERSLCRLIPIRRRSRRSSIRAIAHPLAKAGRGGEEAAEDRDQEGLKHAKRRFDDRYEPVAGGGRDCRHGAQTPKSRATCSARPAIVHLGPEAAS